MESGDATSTARGNPTILSSSAPPTGQVVKRTSYRPSGRPGWGPLGLQSTLSDGTSSYDYGATRIVAATTHQEGSFLSIAEAAVRHSQVARLFTTFHTERWSKAVERIPGRGIRTRAQRELGRAFPGIPVEQVETVGVIPELLHVVALRVPGTGVLSSRSLRAATPADTAIEISLGREESIMCLYPIMSRSSSSSASSSGLVCSRFSPVSPPSGLGGRGMTGLFGSASPQSHVSRLRRRLQSLWD